MQESILLFLPNAVGLLSQEEFAQTTGLANAPLSLTDEQKKEVIFTIIYILLALCECFL